MCAQDGASVAEDDVISIWPLMTPDQRRHAMLLAVSGLQLVQASLQSTLLAEALRRTSITRHQAESRPARQVRAERGRAGQSGAERAALTPKQG